MRHALVLSVLCLSCSAPRGSTSDTPEQAEHHHGSEAGHAHGPKADHKHGDGMPHRFEDAEAWAKQFDNPERAAWQKPDEVIAALNLSPTAKVADIGAGTGYFSMRFAKAVPEGHVFAGDIEADMVEYLGKRAEKEQVANVTPVLGKPDDAALPEPVDVIFLCNVYHHVGDREAYFAKLRESLADGGRLVIVDFKVDAPDDAPGPPKAHRISADQITQELAAADYAQLRIDRDLLPYQYIVEYGVKR
jgi:SAM-dependent methyltransferase